MEEKLTFTRLGEERPFGRTRYYIWPRRKDKVPSKMFTCMRSLTLALYWITILNTMVMWLKWSGFPVTSTTCEYIQHIKTQHSYEVTAPLCLTDTIQYVQSIMNAASTQHTTPSHHTSWATSSELLRHWKR